MPTTDARVDPIATRGGAAGTMMALVYGGPGKRTWQSMPKAAVRDPGDAVVRITTSTICGTDLASASSPPRERRLWAQQEGEAILKRTPGAGAWLTGRSHTVTATLFFDPDGRHVNFESDDRSRSSPDGTFTKLRFSRPLRDYRDFGPSYLAGYDEARWRLPEGEFTYGDYGRRHPCTLNAYRRH